MQQEQDIKHPDTRLLEDLKKVEQALRSAEMNVRIAAENLRQIKLCSQSEYERLKEWCKTAERLRSFMRIQQREARKKEKKLEKQQASQAREKYREAKVLKLQSENFVHAAQKQLDDFESFRVNGDSKVEGDILARAISTSEKTVQSAQEKLKDLSIKEKDAKKEMYL